MELLLKNIGLLCTPLGSTARCGAEQGEIASIPDAMVGIKDGQIVYAGASDPALKAERVLDCGGKLCTPGLVDSHTHLVFGGWRQKEMGLKLAGVPYLDVLKAGGGILNTVKETGKASEDELFKKGVKLLNEMLGCGTTTVEAKSGYGLNLETELKQLRVIKKLNEAHAAEMVPTFLGAHAIPMEYKDRQEEFVRIVIEDMLPVVEKEGLAEFCDVFCETGVFTPDESLRILEAAARHGMKGKIHADEIDSIGGAETAARAGCTSADHLIAASAQGIADMAEKGVVAVLLPATSFYLDKGFAPARDMINAGVPVAVASDFNPGSSPSLNLQFAMNCACLRYRMTPAETLTAVTLNAAAAVGRSDSIGSLEPGKNADVLIWDAPDLEYIFYRYGSNLVESVIKGGVIVR